jgi:hypothetical protein
MHQIEVYEPFEYEGPNPILVIGQGLVNSPDKKEVFLLGVETDLEIDGVAYRQVLVRPRFPDPIERATTSACTVIISLVKADRRIDVGSAYQYPDVVNWGIGKINTWSS